MSFSETHLQFFQVLDRLRKLDWSAHLSTLKPPEFLALNIINDYHRSHPDIPGIYVSAFADQLHITPPTASKMLKQLEHQGWLRRTVNLQNRRNTFVSLTEAGEQILIQEQEHCAASGNRIFQRLGKENTDALLASLNHLIDLLEEEFSTDK